MSKASEELQKYIERQNCINGILIKISDMEIQMKYQIVSLLRKTLDKFEKQSLFNVSEEMTNKLEMLFPGAWICTIGRKYVANIMHEASCYLRVSTENYHILIYKLKWEKETEKKNSALKTIGNRMALAKYQDKFTHKVKKNSESEVEIKIE